MTIVSRADLLRCWYLHDPDDIEGVARSLGFAKSSTRAVKPSKPPQNTMSVNQQMKVGDELALQALPPIETEQMHFYRVVHKESMSASETSPSGYPEWLDASEETLLDPDRQSLVPKLKPLQHQPLVTWPRLWPFLQASLSRLRSGGQPDIDLLIRKLAAGEWMKKIPLKHHMAWSGEARLLIDINSTMFPLRRDLIFLRDKLRQLRGEQGLLIQYIDDGPGGDVYHWEREQEITQPWVTPNPEVPLLIVSDLGALSQSARTLHSWLIFGRRLAAKGCRPRVLMPVPERLIDVRLLNYFDCVVWDRGSRLKVLKHSKSADSLRLKSAESLTEVLINRLAPSVRVDSTLLRAIRYLPSFLSFDIGHEAAVWRHPSIQAQGDEFAWKNKDREESLQAFKHLSPEHQVLMVELIIRYHSQLPEVVFFEALQNCLQTVPDLVEDALSRLTEHYFESLVRTRFKHPDHKGIKRWSGRYRGRQKSDTQGARNEFLAAITGIELKESMMVGKDFPKPENVDLQLMQPFISSSEVVQEYDLLQQGRSLLFKPKRDGVDDFGVQGSTLATIASSVDFISKKATTQQHSTASHLLRFDRDKAVTVAMAGTRSYEFETDRQRVHIEPLTKPDWAIGVGHNRQGLYAESMTQGREVYHWYWNPPELTNITTKNIESDSKTAHQLVMKGVWYSEKFNTPKLPDTPEWADNCLRDEYGLLASLTIKGVEQRFRWVEPTTFLMGSPDDEEGRSSDEKQHKVTLTQGYWLAETACTQALWEVVMKENPSNFKGENNPVEEVSWSDVNSFLDRINRQTPSLALRLPSEAEWENACRAGSQTAFSFEEGLSLENVNYSGKWDQSGYADTALKQSTRIKSFPPNDWGLFEMHGNVLEWCSDVYSSYSKEATTDPQGPEAGDDRVLRGGSWANNGGYCRSAYRYHSEPSYRNDFFGFRLAHGHASQPVRTVASRSAANGDTQGVEALDEGRRATDEIAGKRSGNKHKK